ncbi:hypothetical protein [uncultured Microbacterium sp.]|uniref:hypothetical protein n=1 Tax=uncultured Microbacterium sp. TaxID=191216 RepID=UPI0028DB8919|nr:hypothetical protein [uncultured Microbacterium sp.]
MDRTIVVPGQVAIAQGHRLEVVERLDGVTGEAVIAALRDLETNVRYRLIEETSGDPVRWLGRVLDCTVVLSATGSRTELRLDATGPGAIGATVALDEADAAAEAAKAEADRWGSAVPEPEQTERFW